MPPPFGSNEPASIFTSLFADLTILQGVVLVLAAIVTYYVGRSIYRVTLDPLAKVPGPKLYAISGFPLLWKTNISGRFARSALELHQKYGPVVRTGPNHVAIDGEVAWPEIYSHRKGQDEFVKAPFLGPDQDLILLGASSTEVHRRQRRQLGHAFSESSMYEQELLLTRYVDMFMDKVESIAKQNKPVDLEKWFVLTTFDIIGDLLFGESFHCLDNSNLHPWIDALLSGIRGQHAGHFFHEYPFLRPILLRLMPELALDSANEMTNKYYATEKTEERMEQGETPGGRRDFMTYMLRENREGERLLSREEILANSPIIISAGSETTATALAGFHFYMMRNPVAYKLCTEEIRAAFKSESDINFRTAASGLPYTHAAIEEALRIFPPASETNPRISPGAEVGGYYIPKGVVTRTYHLAMFHNPKNFEAPEEFAPQRFLPRDHPLYEKRFDNDNKAIFQPFATGPRNCIGKNLAYSELRLLVARFLFRFDFELLPGQDDWHDRMRTYIVWDKSPLLAKVTVRKQER